MYFVAKYYYRLVKTEVTISSCIFKYFKSGFINLH